MNSNGQLRAAHLILGYTPISSSFQAPKCVIRARDPCLHRISVVAPGFLLPQGAPVLEGTFVTQPIPKSNLTSQPIPEGIPKITFPTQIVAGESSSTQPTSKEEGEGEEGKEKEIADVSDSDDPYEIFDQPLSPGTLISDLGQFFQPLPSYLEENAFSLDEIGIQRKQRSTLQELLESQPLRDAPAKALQTRLLTPPPTQST